MLKNKSLEDVNCMSDEQLFTKLTPQEAAAIEGGYGLLFESLRAIQIGEGSDNLSLRVNETEVYEGRITSRDSSLINLTGATPVSGLTGAVEIELWDDKVGRRRDTLIGLTSEGGGMGPKIVTLGQPGGDNSVYELKYQVV